MGKVWNEAFSWKPKFLAFVARCRGQKNSFQRQIVYQQIAELVNKVLRLKFFALHLRT